MINTCNNTLLSRETVGGREFWSDRKVVQTLRGAHYRKRFGIGKTLVSRATFEAELKAAKAS